jgi:DNA (cytosine-5)-methyltransferase 1
MNQPFAGNHQNSSLIKPSIDIAAMKSEEIRTLDLFCGAGGSSFGAQRVRGVKIVAGIDSWPPAVQTFAANFPNARVYPEDITQLCPKQIKAEIGPIDLILASPECTSHSNAKGGAKRSDASRQTAFEVVRFARELLPTWIVVENVVDMRDWSKYGELLKQLRSLNYLVQDGVLNARHFGVPQSRERLFILCSRVGGPTLPGIPGTPERAASTILAENTYSFTPLRKRTRAAATISKADHAIKNLGRQQPFLIVYYGSGKNCSGGWQTLDEPLRTITTVDRFGYVIPYRNGHRMRMLQPEELKLAMGFTEEFKLNEVIGLTRRERVKLMGNGVCPPVMEAIVANLIRQRD